MANTGDQISQVITTLNNAFVGDASKFASAISKALGGAGTLLSQGFALYVRQAFISGIMDASFALMFLVGSIICLNRGLVWSNIVWNGVKTTKGWNVRLDALETWYWIMYLLAPTLFILFIILTCCAVPQLANPGYVALNQLISQVTGH